MTRERIISHCAWMAERDRAYAEWAWRWYVRTMPWLITPARAVSGAGA